MIANAPSGQQSRGQDLEPPGHVGAVHRRVVEQLGVVDVLVVDRDEVRMGRVVGPRRPRLGAALGVVRCGAVRGCPARPTPALMSRIRTSAAARFGAVGLPIGMVTPRLREVRLPQLVAAGALRDAEDLVVGHRAEASGARA